jgi:plasmid stabilization system protein ParE
MRVVYHSAVEAELIESARFYEQKLSGLGRRFLDEFDAAVQQISAAPHCWHPVDSVRRRFLMPRFPFGIYYRLADDELRILVVKHHRRHPGYGGERS